MKKLIFALSSAGANGGLIIEKNLVINHMEANRKSITVKDGIGREVNPYSPYDPTHEPNSDLSRFDYFAKHNVGYPCPELANTKPGETVMAELVWQMRANRDLVEAGIDKEIKWIDVNIDLIDGLRPEALRQIWRLVKEESGKQEEDTDKPSDSFSNWGKFILGNIEPKEEKPDILKRIDKIEETVAELVALVNELSIAVRKRFDSLTPPTLKKKKI